MLPCEEYSSRSSFEVRLKFERTCEVPRTSVEVCTKFVLSSKEVRSKFFCEVRFEMHGNIFSVPTVRQTKDRLLPTPWRILRGNRTTSGG